MHTERNNEAHRKVVSRFGDYSDGALCIIKTEHDIRVMTSTNKFDCVGFTTSGWWSEQTRRALIQLLDAMRKDNKESFQKDNRNEYNDQSRQDDTRKGVLIVNKYAGDLKVCSIPWPYENALIFELIATQSKNTCDALIQVFNAMLKDQEERPQ